MRSCVSLVEPEIWLLLLTPLLLIIARYTLVKYKLDGSIDRYIARLITKDFSQIYDDDYFETFSHVACLNFIRILFYLIVNLNWPLFQLDDKNAFLYGNLVTCRRR